MPKLKDTEVLQDAVLHTAIIIVFWYRFVWSTREGFFYISRSRATGWSVSAQEARLRLQNGLKLEGEPAKHRDVFHQGQEQEITPDSASLHTPIMGNKLLVLLCKGLGASCGGVSPQ